MAGLANLVAGDIHASLGAADRLPEIDIHYVFKIAALFGPRLAGRPAAEKLRKDIAEPAGAGLGAASPGGARSRAAEDVGEIEPAEIHIWRGSAAWAARSGAGKPVFRIEPVLIVHLALLGVAQHVIGFLHVLEALFGGLVARVQIGMILPCQFPVRFADFIGGSALGDPEGFVIIVFGCRWHSCQRSAFSYQPATASFR